MEEPYAEVVAQHVTEQADGNARHQHLPVAEQGRDHGHERRGIDERHRTDHHRVAVNLQQSCKQDLQHDRSKDDKEQIAEYGKAA